MAEDATKKPADRDFGFIGTGIDKDLAFHPSSIEDVSSNSPCAENVQPSSSRQISEWRKPSLAAGDMLAWQSTTTNNEKGPRHNKEDEGRIIRIRIRPALHRKSPLARSSNAHCGRISRRSRYT